MSSPDLGTLLNLTRKPPSAGDPTLAQPWRALYPFSIMISRSRTSRDLYRYSLRSERIDEVVAHASSDQTFGDLCAKRALDLLSLYLADSAVSPLYKALVEVENAVCTDIVRLNGKGDLTHAVLRLFRGAHLASVDLRSVRAD